MWIQGQVIEILKACVPFALFFLWWVIDGMKALPFHDYRDWH